jgi:hypothetical protein
MASADRDAARRSRRTARVPGAVDMSNISQADLDQATTRFVAQCENDYYAEWFWFPYQQRAWVNCWRNDGARADAQPYPSQHQAQIEELGTYLIRVQTNATLSAPPRPQTGRAVWCSGDGRHAQRHHRRHSRQRRSALPPWHPELSRARHGIRDSHPATRRRPHSGGLVDLPARVVGRHPQRLRATRCTDAGGARDADHERLRGDDGAATRQQPRHVLDRGPHQRDHV